MNPCVILHPCFCSVFFFLYLLIRLENIGMYGDSFDKQVISWCDHAHCSMHESCLSENRKHGTFLIKKLDTYVCSNTTDAHTNWGFWCKCILQWSQQRCKNVCTWCPPCSRSQASPVLSCLSNSGISNPAAHVRDSNKPESRETVGLVLKTWQRTKRNC